jgi:uncharacterized membrane protein YiaA
MFLFYPSLVPLFLPLLLIIFPFSIFVFVLSQSQLTFLDSTRTFLWGLLDRSSLNGESGYYLTVLEAAIETLKGQEAVLEKLERANAIVAASR